MCRSMFAVLHYVDRGYTLDIRLSKDSGLALQKYGDYLYDAAIIFAPKTHGECRLCCYALIREQILNDTVLAFAALKWLSFLLLRSDLLFPAALRLVTVDESVMPEDCQNHGRFVMT